MRNLFIAILIVVFLAGCADLNFANKMQNGYFDQNGKRAGYSGSHPCMKQAEKETGNSVVLGNCGHDPKCKELVESCMKEKGFIEARPFETTDERMSVYRRAYEEGWIKPGMTRLEVVSLIGAPQIATYQLIPPRKIWWYCRSAAKTALIGYNFVFQIIWIEDKVESVERKFKI